ECGYTQPYSRKACGLLASAAQPASGVQAGDADDNSDSDSTDSAPTPVRSPITASLDAESPRVGTECCGSNSPTDTTPDDKVTTNNGYLLVGSAVNNNATPRSPGNTRPPFQAGSADLSHD
ncbi:unnamed protein product, partial [Sphacelaria rigidula]